MIIACSARIGLWDQWILHSSVPSLFALCTSAPSVICCLTGITSQRGDLQFWETHCSPWTYTPHDQINRRSAQVCSTKLDNLTVWLLIKPPLLSLNAVSFILGTESTKRGSKPQGLWINTGWTDVIVRSPSRPPYTWISNLFPSFYYCWCFSLDPL